MMDFETIDPDLPDYRLVRVPRGKRKKIWIIAEIEFDDDYNACAWKEVQPVAEFNDLEDLHDWREVLTKCLFHYPKYRVYRGKLIETHEL